MNKKTLAVLMLMGISLAALAADPAPNNQERLEQLSVEEKELTVGRMRREEQAAEEARKKAEELAGNKTYDSGDIYTDCEQARNSQDKNQAAINKEFECNILDKLSPGNKIVRVDRKASEIKSQDGAITCKRFDSFTFDFEGCEQAVAAYNAVVVADSFMNLTQEVRTVRNDQKLQEDTAKQVAQGESQGAVLDSATKKNEFHKDVEKEKVIAYSAAVAALVYAYQNIPVIDDARDVCKAQNKCQETTEKFQSRIIANKSAKAALVKAITEYTGKGIAAGIKMGNHDKAAKTLTKAKQSYVDEDSDMMVERCAFNPTDPLCIQPGNRVATSNYSGGGFSLGDGQGNAFNLSPETVAPVEMGEETNLGGESVASVNSPFIDEAKDANEILNPAGAAQMQPGAGAGAGAGGGGGGGMGGGSASLGSDLAGAEAESNKEAQIKANKISGNYSSSGGGGYRGVAGTKEKANPFASLFNNKAGGGIEEDKSVAADIDGAASGLFQKISNRYVKIQADKRIEASNLE